MVNVETRAMRTLEMLTTFMDDVIVTGKLRNVYSDDVGNLENRLLQQKAALETALGDYKDKRSQNEMFPGTFAAACTKAELGLRSGVDKTNVLWIREVLPRLRDDLNQMPEKVEANEVEVEADRKQDFLNGVREATGTLDKILDSGKAIWDLVKEHKDLFGWLGLLLPLIV